MEKAGHLAAIAAEQRKLLERLERQALHDDLTDLPNRTLFRRQLEEHLTAARREGREAALLFVDLDDFKGVNDSLGHGAGDAVLLQVAGRLRDLLRPGEGLARLGGDEFTLILPQGGETAAREAAARVLRAFAAPLRVAGQELYVSPSVGVSVFPQGGDDAETLLRHADRAMYHAKQRKLGFAVFGSEMDRLARERLLLASHLRRAPELGELEVHYQAQVRLQGGAVVGVEALLRWRHPEWGLIPPSQFIPVAEETGLIVPLGEWVLREVCRQGAVWRQQGCPPIRLAVNVSALQFGRPDFVETVARCLKETGLPAECLELELTERVVMTDVQESAERMDQLRALGVSLSVDDFGKGYSSLSYLPRLPINLLKIDRSFVSGLGPASPAFPVVRAIVSLAQSLGLTTIAEGIETEDELGVLRDLGCDLGQGYLFARPAPASEVRFGPLAEQASELT